MTLHFEKVNRKNKKRKKSGTVRHRTFCDTTPCRPAKADEGVSFAIHMPIKMKGVCLYGICIRCRICFPLCADIQRKRILSDLTYWGKSLPESFALVLT